MAFFTKRRVVFWIVLLLMFFAALKESERQASIGYSPEEQYFRELTGKTIGLTCNRDIPYLREVVQEGNTWIIRLNADTHQDADMIRGMVFFKSMNFLDTVFRGREDFEAVTLQWFFPIRISREIVDQPIIKIKMTRDAEGDADWNLVLTRELPIVVDEYWEHPVLKGSL